MKASRSSWLSGLVLAGALAAFSPALAYDTSEPTGGSEPGESGKFQKNEIVNDVADFFGTTSEGAAQLVEKVFHDQGEPTAYIRGEEGAGAFIGGLRYGKGELVRKGQPPVVVYWQGPSVGFDFGGNASKSFVLVYNLDNVDDLFHRFPGAEGNGYFVAGIGVNYQQSDNIILAPIRTGVGLRGGVSAGYLRYTRERNWMPF